jgi:hypothetical protein
VYVTESPVTPVPGAGAVTLPRLGAPGTGPHELGVQVGATLLQAPSLWHVVVTEPSSE